MIELAVNTFKVGTRCIVSQGNGVYYLATITHKGGSEISYRLDNGFESEGDITEDIVGTSKYPSILVTPINESNLYLYLDYKYVNPEFSDLIPTYNPDIKTTQVEVNKAKALYLKYDIEYPGDKSTITEKSIGTTYVSMADHLGFSVRKDPVTDITCVYNEGNDRAVYIQSGMWFLCKVVYNMLVTHKTVPVEEIKVVMDWMLGENV